MSDIQKLGYYVRTYDRDIFITKEQRDVLYRAIDNDAKYFDIEDSRIMTSQIKEIVPSEKYAMRDQWACPKHPDNYVPRGKVCGYC